MRTIILIILPRYQGVSDQRLQTRGGERWPGNGSVGDATLSPGGPSCEGPGASTMRRGVLTAGTVECQSEANDPSGLAPQRWVACHARETPDPGDPSRSKPINTARGTPWDLADLRHDHRTSTSLEVARRRGPWVPRDPWRPARPRFFTGHATKMETGRPGALQTIRAMTLAPWPFER